LIRIGGRENAQYVPLIHTPGLAEYDVIVDDAPTSPNTKEKVWSMVIQMFPMLRQLPLPPQALVELMKYSPFPVALTQKLEQIAQQAGGQGQDPTVQAKAQLMQSQAQRHQQQGALDQARAGHVAAETQVVALNAQTEALEKAAKIESLRAGALADLAKVGLAHRDQNLSEAEAAVDTLLQADQQQHDKTLDVAQHQHDQTMDYAQHALDSAELAQQAQQPKSP
jgi:hypothetical protein